MKFQIFGGKVVLPGKIKKTNIIIENGIIKSIGNKLNEANIKTIDAKGKYVLPGFIDIHTNGIAGFDVTNGKYNPQTGRFMDSRDNYLSSLEKALKSYARHGTTLVGLTSLEHSVNKLKKVFRFIGEYKNNYLPLSELIFGIYMEGTFMKDDMFKGAHNSKYFFPPSKKLFAELQKVSGGNIKIVNVVPEWGKKAINFIDYLKTNKIIIAMGHTGATADETNLAIQSGASLGIHLFNGPSLSSYKPFDGGGAVEAFIKSDNVFVELIADGYHVSPEYLLDVIKRKGIDKSLVISDGMFSINMPGIKQFSISGHKARISENREYITLANTKKKNALCGSALTMDKAFENLLDWFTIPKTGIWNKLHIPKKIDEAIVIASNLCSLTPAKALRINCNTKQLSKTPGVGSIETGNRADILITDITRNNTNYKVDINKVFLAGEEVYS